MPAQRRSGNEAPSSSPVPRGVVEDAIDSRQMDAVGVLLPPELRGRSRKRSVGRSRERSPERSSPLAPTSRETAGERR
jgi:hypothetical protein